MVVDSNSGRYLQAIFDPRLPQKKPTKFPVRLKGAFNDRLRKAYNEKLKITSEGPRFNSQCSRDPLPTPSFQFL